MVKARIRLRSKSSKCAIARKWSLNIDHDYKSLQRDALQACPSFHDGNDGRAKASPRTLPHPSTHDQNAARSPRTNPDVPSDADCNSHYHCTFTCHCAYQVDWISSTPSGGQASYSCPGFLARVCYLDSSVLVLDQSWHSTVHVHSWSSEGRSEIHLDGDRCCRVVDLGYRRPCEEASESETSGQRCRSGQSSGG